MIRLPIIGFKWKLLAGCALLVTLPTVIMGVLSYKALERQAYRTIEEDLQIISQDWQKITHSYIEQSRRVLKREEVLVQQRLRSVVQDVIKMMDGFLQVESIAPGPSVKEILFDKISEIRIGRGGHVSVLDSDYRYVVSKDRTLIGQRLFDLGSTQMNFAKEIRHRLGRLEKGEDQVLKYLWHEADRAEPRMRTSVIAYFKPWKLIVSANIYYTDYKSYEIVRQLKDELRHKMADQQISATGYIWVLNSAGEYVVSKDRLRDGENVINVRDADNRLIIQEMIDLAHNLGSADKAAIYYYSWRNLLESRAFEKLAAITYVPDWDWIIGASAYRKDYLQELESIQFDILKVCMAAIAGGTLVAFFLAVGISRPILHLQEKSNQVAKGNLDVTIDPRVTAQRDEIGSLARAFNDMIANLRSLIQRMEDTQLTLEERNEALAIAMDKAEAATKVKDDFLARMSHEIRTPMNAIIGLTNLALRTELNSTQKDYLATIEDSSRLLLNLINDVLDFSKIEAGKLELETIDFMLHHVIDRTANLLRERAADNKNELYYIIEKDVPLAFNGDPLRVGQILINLVDNAIKFTRQGVIVIRVALYKSESVADSSQVNLQLSVQDSGVGIPADKLDMLFDAFSQSDDSVTRRFGGTGLGLAICQRLVQKMGGRIWVESEPDRGSTFSFTLCLGRQAAQERVVLIPPPDLRDLRVLVVDDNETARQILDQMLRGYGFQVQVASFALEGLVQMEVSQLERPFDLVVLDWLMSPVDGIQMAERILAHPCVSHQPNTPKIIMVTMYAHEEFLGNQKETDSVIDGYLMKPITSSELFNEIMKVFGRHAATLPRPELSVDLVDLAVSEYIRGARVLLVEDNEVNRKIVTDILENAGLQVDVAENGQVAVELLRPDAPAGDPSYDVVLMDVQMPVMDGYAATRLIRKNPSFANLPIIAITAYALKGDRERCIEAGMNDYISKPIDESELFATLSRWIRPVPRKPRDQAPPPRVMEDPWLDMPDYISGIDIKRGLALLRGNTGLYRNILMNFLDKCLQAMERVETAINQKAIDEARQCVHSIKGSAGNVGAYELYAASVELEKALRKETHEGIEPLLEDFSKRLSEITSSLQQLNLVPVLTPGAEAPDEPIQGQDAEHPLRQLWALLNQSDSRSRHALPAVKAELKDPAYRVQLVELERAVYNMNFKGALSVVSHLATKLEIKLPEDDR